jgi:fucose 4-O-acetylase-like acetyltransferase
MQLRANWVDYGKGIGIILVVYAHLLSSAYHGGIQVPAHFFNLSDSIIYGFHMPFFFFLSGLFVEGSFRKRGAKDYLLDKFLRIFYPYIIWSVLQISAEILFSSQTQKGAGIPDLLAIFYRPWGQFWFLYVLLLMHITYVVFSYFGKYTLPLMLIASVIVFFSPISTGLFEIFRFCNHLLFFTVGIVLGRKVMQVETSTPPLWTVILLFVALIGSGYFIFENLLDPMRLAEQSRPFYFLYLSALGIIACSTLAQYLARLDTGRFLQTLGVHSLQIYLVHMLVGVGIRMVLTGVFGIQNWVAHILIGMTFALAIPILMQKISNRLNFPYLFELKLGRKNDQ